MQFERSLVVQTTFYCQRYKAVCDKWRHENQTGFAVIYQNKQSLNFTVGYIGEVW